MIAPIVAQGMVDVAQHEVQMASKRRKTAEDEQEKASKRFSWAIKSWKAAISRRNAARARGSGSAAQEEALVEFAKRAAHRVDVARIALNRAKSKLSKAGAALKNAKKRSYSIWGAIRARGDAMRRRDEAMGATQLVSGPAGEEVPKSHDKGAEEGTPAHPEVQQFPSVVAQWECSFCFCNGRSEVLISR